MDIWLLRDAYGGAASFHNLAWVAAASQMRVLHCDRGIDCHRHFREDSAQLRQAWANAEAVGSVVDVRVARRASTAP